MVNVGLYNFCSHPRKAQHRSKWADCVEKLRISDAVIFRKEPVMLKSQMRSAMRRRENFRLFLQFRSFKTHSALNRR
jgi:hypothetical protein